MVERPFAVGYRPDRAALVLVCDCGYVWTRKHNQFMERAQPTEALLRYVRGVAGPVHLHCFPYGLSIALVAVEVAGGRSAPVMVTDEAPGVDTPNVFCLGDRKHRSIMKPQIAELSSF